MSKLINPVISPHSTSDSELLRTQITFSEKVFPQVIAQLQDDKPALKALRTLFREIGIKSCTLHGTEFIGGAKSIKPPYIFQTAAGVFWGIDRYRGRLLEVVDWNGRLLTANEVMQCVEAYIRRTAPTVKDTQKAVTAKSEEPKAAQASPVNILPVPVVVAAPVAVTAPVEIPDSSSLHGMLLGLADKLQRRDAILADIQKADKTIGELETMITETRAEITKLQNSKIRLVADMAELDRVNAAWTQLQAVLGTKS